MINLVTVLINYFAIRLPFASNERVAIFASCQKIATEEIEITSRTVAIPEYESSCQVSKKFDQKRSFKKLD